MMMKSAVNAIAAVWVVLCACLPTCFASIVPPPEPFEVLSANGEYRFAVAPDEEMREGECLGTLYSRTAGGEWEAVWERRLINDISPLKVLVADSGDFVVTLGDWGEYAPLAIAVYKEAGRLSYALPRSEAVRALYPADFAPPVEEENSEEQHRRHSFGGEELDVLLPAEDDEVAVVIAPFSDDFFVLGLRLGTRYGEEDVGSEAWGAVKQRTDVYFRRRAENK